MKIHNKYLYFFKGESFVLSQTYMTKTVGKCLEFRIGRYIFYRFYLGSFPKEGTIEYDNYKHYIAINKEDSIDLISLKRMILL